VITDPSGDIVIRRWDMAPLVQEIFTLNNLMIRMGDRLVGDLGLTGTRWMLIGALNNYEDPPTLTELSGDALLSVQNVSRMVASMEDDGLVERFTLPGKGRSVFVRLTEKAKAVDEESSKAGGCFVSRLLEGFSDEERGQLQGMLDRLIVNLARFEREVDERARACKELGDADPLVHAVGALIKEWETGRHNES
jgi:DNA-binding MarR family transcriptional regulator